MSLVGTRPILQDELQKYELHHRARIAIKPGITGMWQVSGRSDITDFEEVVRLDTEYISKGEQQAELEKFSKELKISDNVKFMGQKANVQTYIVNASVFVSSSDYEGMLELICIIVRIRFTLEK